MLEKIAAAAEIGPEDCVLEIGPGIGTLTQVLAEHAGQVVAVEIDPELIREHTAVSEPVARAMAENIRTITGADFAVSTTGLAGPDGDGIHEVGTVFCGLAMEGKTEVIELHLGANRTRDYIRRCAGNFCFDMLRRAMTGLPMMNITEQN